MVSQEKTGITGSVYMLFALPRDDAKWTKKLAKVHFVEGHFHKIELPGLETRSGEGFGITTTFHIIQDMAAEGQTVLGKVAKFIVQNGRLMAVEVVAENAELVD